MTAGFDLWNGGFKSVKPQIETVVRNGKMCETQKIDGKIQRVSVFEDLNGDGKFSENEITTVQQYSYRKDGTLASRTEYHDKDHDGYSDDRYLIDQYDENEILDKTIYKKDESIEEMKQKAANGRCCDEVALGNRKMSAHRNGFDKLVCY